MGGIWRNIGLTSGARIYSVLAGSVSIVVTARALGPGGRGTVAAAITWASLFSTFGFLSLGQVAIHRATGKKPEDWLGPTLAALLFMTGAVSLVGWVAAATLYLATDGSVFGGMPGYALVLGFVALPFLVWEQYSSSLLAAVGQLGFYNRREVLGRTLGVALVVVIVGVAHGGIAGALVAMLVAQLVVSAAGWRYLIGLAGPSLRFDGGTLRSMVVDGLKLHMNAIGTFLFINAAILIVQAERGPSETGPFQVAVQIMLVAILIPQAASLVLYGEVARLGPDRAWTTNRRVLVTLAIGMLGVAAVAYLITPAVLPIIFGADFKSAVPIFQILVFCLVGQTFSAVMAPQWIGRGLFWQASVLTVALGLGNVLACALLVHSDGMRGAAYALLGVNTVFILGNGLMALWVDRRAAADSDAQRPTPAVAEAAASDR